MVRGLPLGVSESGLEALRTWRFPPGPENRRVRIELPMVGGFEPSVAERSSAEGVAWWLRRLHHHDSRLSGDCEEIFELDRISRDLVATIPDAVGVFERFMGTRTVAQHLGWLRSNEDVWLIAARHIGGGCIPCLGAITLLQRDLDLRPARLWERRELRASLQSRGKGKVIEDAEVGKGIAWATVSPSSAAFRHPQRSWPAIGAGSGVTSSTHFWFGPEQTLVCGVGREPRTWYFERRRDGSWRPMCSSARPWIAAPSAS